MSFRTRLAGFGWSVALVAALGWVPAAFSQATAPYPRAGWEADIFRLPPRLNVRGTATILDARTIRLSHFYFDGTVPLVFGHLGTNNTDDAFLNGPRIGDELVRAYDNETLVLQLPEGQTLDGYSSISIFCEPAPLNLGSATFAPPVAPRVDVTPIGGPYLAITVTGPPRRIYRVEATDDPARTNSWQTILEMMSFSSSFEIYDSTTNAMRFYRAFRD